MRSPRAIKVIFHPQPRDGSVRTAADRLGQVVGFLAALDVWDKPSSKPRSFNPQGLFLMQEVTSFVFCSGSVLVWLLVALRVTDLFLQQQQQLGLGQRVMVPHLDFGTMGKDAHPKNILVFPQCPGWWNSFTLNMSHTCPHKRSSSVSLIRSALSSGRKRCPSPGSQSQFMAWGATTAGSWQWCEGGCCLPGLEMSSSSRGRPCP